MIIKTLVENTSCSQDYKSQHGLSLYIETNYHTILFDMGADNLFLENAVKMGADISKVDIAVISHGHYDHGGGLRTFLRENTNAKIYLHKKAFKKHCSIHGQGEVADIGLENELKDNQQIMFTEDYFRINESLELFSDVKRKELLSLSNKDLFMKDEDQFSEDTFAHEQNLIISENGKTILITGCAHKGIVNIVKHFMDLKGSPADYVIGGFHLSNPGSKKSENPELISKIGKYLASTGSQYYTCHCTGIEGYMHLQQEMKDRVKYLSTGDKIQI